MGLFSSKKTYVSSSVYNMAGDIASRPNYLKTLMSSHVLTDNGSKSFGSSLRDGYMRGPGMKLAAFGRWAAAGHYPAIGVGQANLYTRQDVSADLVLPLVPKDPGQIVNIQRVEMKTADYSYWAEQWMLEHYPELISTNWTSDFDEADGTITVTLAGGISATFEPTDFDPTKLYVYALYNIVTDPDGELMEVGDRAKLLIYRVGTGGTAANLAIDARASSTSQTGFYLPFIPLRLDNEMIDESHYSDVREQNEKAYRKLTGSKKYQEELIKPLLDNASLKDMDYVYVMLAVSLNSREMAAKEYLYRFFDRLRLTQVIGSSQYSSWAGTQSTFTDTNDTWTEWRLAQENPANPAYGSAMPGLGTAYSMPSNEVRIRGMGTLGNSNVDMSMTWQAISQTSGTGQRKPGAKPGDYFVEWLDRDTYGSQMYSDGSVVPASNQSVDVVAIHRQVTANSWTSLIITGLVHRNYIYDGKFVETTGKAALADTEESGFLVPLHYDTFQELSIVQATQLSTACVYMVVNSYQVVKTGFFSSFFFKILLVVAVIAISVATGGTGAASIGLLGTNAAVGTAIGLSGTLAIIAGAVANAIVAMVLIRIVQAGATLVLGEKLGAIIGAIAAVVAVQVGVAFQANATVSQIFGSLMKADNIINMTSAVGNGVAGYIQAGARETVGDIQRLQKDYAQQFEEIQRRTEENLGINRARLDPLLLLSDGAGAGISEEAGAFLERTLMTGSDVAELSLSLLSNFPQITLSTELHP